MKDNARQIYPEIFSIEIFVFDLVYEPIEDIFDARYYNIGAVHCN